MSSCTEESLNINTKKQGSGYVANLDTNIYRISSNKLSEFSLYKIMTCRDKNIFWRSSLNVTSAFFYLFGCIYWVMEATELGSALFVLGNLGFTISAAWQAYELVSNYQTYIRPRKNLFLSLNFAPTVGLNYLGSDERSMGSLNGEKILNMLIIVKNLGIFSCILQILSSLIFNVGCALLVYEPSYQMEILYFWFVGSILSYIQALIAHISSNQLMGNLLPLWPSFVLNDTNNNVDKKYENQCQLCKRKLCIHQCVPALFFNSTGALLFLIGSVFLFYPVLEVTGGWLYLIGSVFFCFASVADFIKFIDNQLKIR